MEELDVRPFLLFLLLVTRSDEELTKQKRFLTAFMIGRHRNSKTSSPAARPL